MPPSTKAHDAIFKGHPGERVALLRRRKGWTREQLAHTATLAADTLGNLELGKPYSSQTLSKVAVALDTTLAYLLTPID